MGVVVMNAWQIMFKGGPMMWVILGISIIAVAVGINRLMALAAVERRLARDKEGLAASLRAGDLKKTMHLCEANDALMGRVLKAGIMKSGASRDVIKGAMEEVFDYEAFRLKEHMDVLGLSVNAAPLIGLLGTVNAMTVVFHAVQVRSNALSPLAAGDLASGIWQALLTTAAGLTVGVLAFVLYSFCAMRINAVIAYSQRAITEMANILQQLAELKGSGEEVQ